MLAKVIKTLVINQTILVKCINEFDEIHAKMDMRFRNVLADSY